MTLNTSLLAVIYHSCTITTLQCINQQTTLEVPSFADSKNMSGNI